MRQSTTDHGTLHCSIMPDMCAGGYLTGVLQGPFEAWKVVVSVATSALWLLCGFIFRRGATSAYRKNLGFQDIAYGGAYGHRAVTPAAQFFACPRRLFICPPYGAGRPLVFPPFARMCPEGDIAILIYVCVDIR